MSENIMTREEVEQKVNQLIHDAQHADSGAMMAKIMGDMPSATEFEAKAAQLRLEARTIDPHRTCEAWEWDHV